MGRPTLGCTSTSALCLGLMALALSACSGPSAQTPPPVATDAVPSSTPLPTVTSTAESTPTPAPPSAEELVRQALTAQSAGEIEAALSFYSSGGQWILVDLEPRGVLASAPCAPDLLSPLEKFGCIGGDQLNGLMTYLADRHAILTDTTIRTATTKNRNNTGAVVGETDAVYVEGTLSFDPAGSGTAETAQVLTVYALREGLIRAFATVLLGYGATPLQMPVGIYGLYTTNIKPADIIEDAHSGLWDIAFLPDGRYLLYEHGELSLTGNFTADVDQVTITEDSDCDVPEPGVHGGDLTSTYRWSADGTTLRLTAVEDGCPIRQNILTSNPWTRTR
jgi:hypothetical protein